MLLQYILAYCGESYVARQSTFYQLAYLRLYARTKCRYKKPEVPVETLGRRRLQLLHDSRFCYYAHLIRCYVV